MNLNEVRVVIYSDRGEKQSEETLFELYSFLRNMKPERLLVALDPGNDRILSFLHQKFPAIPIESVHCRVIGIKRDESSVADQEVKRKILSLGLDTIAKYVNSNSSTMESINSEVTISLFRAFFQFYSSAMPSDYEAFYESRRFCILGQLVHMKPKEGDVLIVPPWDAYWFIDEFNYV